MSQLEETDVKTQKAVQKKATVEPAPTSIPETINTIGTRIMEARQYKSLSRQTFGDQVGVSVTCVRLWEINHTVPQSDRIVTIADVLQCDLRWLLVGENDEGSNPTLETEPKETSKRSKKKWGEIFKLTDDAMAPILPMGTQAYIDTGETARSVIKNGGLYLLAYGGVTELRQLFVLPHNRMRIKAYNTTDYPEYIADVDDVYVIGQVYEYHVVIR